MRTARIKADTNAYYHCMSRVIEGRFIFGESEKERFRSVMRKLEGFCCLQILTYTIMDNHFHILIKEPVRIVFSVPVFIYRLSLLYAPIDVEFIATELAILRKNGEHASAEDLKGGYTYRMFDISEFFKTLKQKFTQYYNRKHDRRGPLWEGRFKSIMVEGSGHVLSTMAAYIDLNAVRVGIVEDPQHYRCCGYAEAVAGSRAARDGLGMVMESVSLHMKWSEVGPKYRKRLYMQGGERGVTAEGRPLRGCFSEERVQQILDEGGILPIEEALRCRVRYFSDGLVLGSRQFVEDVFREHREEFGRRRGSGARQMKHGQWRGLCTLRALRLKAVSLS